MGEYMLPALFYKRLKIVLIVVILCMTAICFKLSFNTIFMYSSLKESAEELWNRSFPIKAERGKIIDINNNVLVDNEPTISVYAVPNQIKNKEETARILSSYIDMKEEDIYSRITKKASSVTFHPSGRKISYDDSNLISKANLEGIYLVQDTLRTYPYNEYMASLLGFVGIDNIGFAGIESYYNSYLSGKDGSLSYMMDAKGGLFSNKYYTLESPLSGLNLKLTLDINIQNILERELSNSYLQYSASEVMGIIMNPNNGEILAIGNRPTYNNNNYQQYSQEIYNRLLPVYNSFEPGSTFKAMTFAAALNEGLFDMHKDTYYDKGYEIVSGQRIKSWKKGGHGLQTYLEVLQNSSNPGFVSLSRKLGTEKMYEYVEKFGFLAKTNIDIQGENKGIFFSKDNFHELECATTSFGQGISVTAIQLVTAFSSVINGGYLYQPKIAKSFISSSGETIYNFEPILKRQVISKETSEKMRYALECVVAKGSGRKAFVDGYRIGGKTGTAQIAENGVYKDGAYILSFIAGAPMNDPKVVVYFSIKEPHNCIQYGGTTVGPIIQRIMSEVLDYLEIEKDYESEINKTLTWMDEKTTVVGNYIGQEKKKIKNNLLKFQYYGEGNIVIDQIPKVGTIVPEGSTIMLQLSD